jgi:hypothetical protein
VCNKGQGKLQAGLAFLARAGVRFQRFLLDCSKHVTACSHSLMAVRLRVPHNNVMYALTHAWMATMAPGRFDHHLTASWPLLTGTASGTLSIWISPCRAWLLPSPPGVGIHHTAQQQMALTASIPSAEHHCTCRRPSHDTRANGRVTSRCRPVPLST